MTIILTRTKAERNSAGQSKEYIALPGTYSDHMTLEDETKKALFSGIEEAKFLCIYRIICGGDEVVKDWNGKG